MYYHIKPIDMGSSSMAWFVDQPGFEAVKNRYTHYDKDPSNIIDRWHEFGFEETNIVPIDFGGMLWINEPDVHLRDDDVVFKMKVSQLPYFIDTLKNIQESDKCKGLCSFSMKWWNLCIGLETANKLLIMALEKQINCEEMTEGVENYKSTEINRLNKHPNLKFQ